MSVPSFTNTQKDPQAASSANLPKDRLKEEVSTYYNAALQASAKGSATDFFILNRMMREADPTLKSLNLDQKVNLLSQEKILKISKELTDAKSEIALLKSQLDSQKSAGATKDEKPSVAKPTLILCHESDEEMLADEFTTPEAFDFL